MRISAIGSGYLGLVSAACFAKMGHDVVSMDNDHEKIAMLERGEVPIHERFLLELLERHRGGRLRFSTDIPENTATIAHHREPGVQPLGPALACSGAAR
jgi:UDPglucose 6-dehydrogenase